MSSSSSRRESPAAPFALIPFTWPPFSSTWAKALNSVLREDRGEIDELHAETGIRFIAAEARHRLVVAHAREGRRRPRRR